MATKLHTDFYGPTKVVSIHLLPLQSRIAITETNSKTLQAKDKEGSKRKLPSQNKMEGNQHEVEGKVTKSCPSFSISANTSSKGENAGLVLWTPNHSSPGCEEPAGIEGESLRARPKLVYFVLVVAFDCSFLKLKISHC